MALDGPREQDIVATINEIQVAIDPIIKPHAERTTLTYNPEVDGLTLMGPDFDQNSC